jgi:predicted metal-binding membrane protein
MEALLRRDRGWVVAGLVISVGLCWAWLVPVALDMRGDMDGLSAWMMRSRWDLPYTLAIFAMWIAMMIGMMLPSAAPTLLLYARICRTDANDKRPMRRVYAFAAGYLLAWVGFSVLATGLQWALVEAQLLDPMMQSSSKLFSSVLLVAAGAYQWSQIKQRCLARCRSPAEFISSHWRRGIRGALRMGWAHGLFCLGCCWALMLLLFVGGVMSLAWIGAITLLVLFEKLLPAGVFAGRMAGGLIIAAGIWNFL